jgi:ABC-type antimicrobial peptide transport system permease subunit
MALGGTPGDVLRYVLGAGLRAAAIGLAVGAAGAVAASTALPALLVGARPLDPGTYLAVGALLAAVAFVAAWAPARRATRVDPMIALRTE